jgi:hypothetical protein
MNIRVKAGDIEIEYAQLMEATQWPFLLGKNDESSDKFIDRIQTLINGVDQLLKTKNGRIDD